MTPERRYRQMLRYYRAMLTSPRQPTAERLAELWALLLQARAELPQKTAPNALRAPATDRDPLHDTDTEIIS